MNITNVMTDIDNFIHQAKKELDCGNEFQARRQLVNIRELLMNELPLGEPTKRKADIVNWGP